MKSKLLICAVLVLSVSGLASAPYLTQQNTSIQIAERMAT